MSAWLTRLLLATSLCLTTGLASAAPISYEFNVTDFGTSGGLSAPTSPVQGSFTADGLVLQAITLSLGTHTYSLAEVGISNFFGGSLLLYGLNASASAVSGTNDFWLLFDPVALSVSTFAYTVEGTPGLWTALPGSATLSVVPDNAVPEPASLLLVALALLAVTALRRRA